MGLISISYSWKFRSDSWSASVSWYMQKFASGLSIYRVILQSGAVACYLAVLLPIAVFAFRNTDHKQNSEWPVGLELGWHSPAPSSFLAAAIGTAITYWDEFKVFIARRQAIYFIGILLVVMVLADGFYTVKKDSADRRLMMWKVALQAAVAAPLTGME